MGITYHPGLPGRPEQPHTVPPPRRDHVVSILMTEETAPPEPPIRRLWWRCSCAAYGWQVRGRQQLPQPGNVGSWRIRVSEVLDDAMEHIVRELARVPMERGQSVELARFPFNALFPGIDDTGSGTSTD